MCSCREAPLDPFSGPTSWSRGVVLSGLCLPAAGQRRQTLTRHRRRQPEPGCRGGSRRRGRDPSGSLRVRASPAAGPPARGTAGAGGALRPGERPGERSPGPLPRGWRGLAALAAPLVPAEPSRAGAPPQVAALPQLPGATAGDAGGSGKHPGGAGAPGCAPLVPAGGAGRRDEAPRPWSLPPSRSLPLNRHSRCRRGSAKVFAERAGPGPRRSRDAFGSRCDPSPDRYGEGREEGRERT